MRIEMCSKIKSGKFLEKFYEFVITRLYENFSTHFRKAEEKLNQNLKIICKVSKSLKITRTFTICNR